MVLSMFQFMSILVKLRAMLSFSETQANQINDEQEANKIKMVGMLKVIFCFIFSLVFTNLFIQFYWIYVALFVYPIFQIYHNTFNVVSKNCFLFKVHFFMCFPLVFFPIAMRFEYFDFFQLKSNMTFCVIVLSITAFFLFFMFLQKMFGRCFYLPACLNPSYYNYKRKVADL